MLTFKKRLRVYARSMSFPRLMVLSLGFLSFGNRVNAETNYVNLPNGESRGVHDTTPAESFPDNILSGELKAHFNERLFSFNEHAEKFYEFKATHFKMRFYLKQKKITQGALITTKFYGSVYADSIYRLFQTDSNNIARIVFEYQDSALQEKNGLLGIFRPKAQNRITNYFTVKRSLYVSLKLTGDSIYWKLSWTGVPTGNDFNVADSMNPKELFLVSGNDSVQIIFSSKKNGRTFTVDSYRFYLHDKLLAILQHVKNDKFSYSLDAGGDEKQKQFAYAVISLFCLMFEERDTLISEDN